MNMIFTLDMAKFPSGVDSQETMLVKIESVLSIIDIEEYHFSIDHPFSICYNQFV